MLKIDDLRLNYTLSSLEIEAVCAHPTEQLELWFSDAIAQKITEPNAMILSTVDENHKPHARVVLAKSISKDGIQFFTNYNSNKAKELMANFFASLTFFYPDMERQIRIEGIVSKISKAESETYFHSRPIASQIGAHVSEQSKPIASRQVLEQKQAQLEAQFEGKIIPIPDFWGGYILKPTYFEFWQGRTSRLHDRIAYTFENNNWKIERLSP